MPITRRNPAELFPQYRNYSHAVEVSNNSRLLFISGLNGYLADGTTMPDSFEEQGELIWGYIGVSSSQASGAPSSPSIGASSSLVSAERTTPMGSIV